MINFDKRKVMNNQIRLKVTEEEKLIYLMQHYLINQEEFETEMKKLKDNKMEERPKYLREVIRIDKEERADEKPVEFTHWLKGHNEWDKSLCKPDGHYFNKVLYIGKDLDHGDLFAAYTPYGSITIYKGHLNSGKY